MEIKSARPCMMTIRRITTREEVTSSIVLGGPMEIFGGGNTQVLKFCLYNGTVTTL